MRVFGFKLPMVDGLFGSRVRSRTVFPRDTRKIEKSSGDSG